jgi:Putative beta-barrel porin-2, OmpL-like. bbp2
VRKVFLSAAVLLTPLSLAHANSTSGSSDCSLGFLSRLTAAYREDANPAPTDPNAPAPARRGLDSPFSSPPFPSAEWQLGGMDYPIGVPNENSQYPLEKALACTDLGSWMQKNHIEVSGWINPSMNISSSNFNAYPLAYATRPNRVEFDQFLFRIERLPDTVQADNIDWGFHFDNLYGYDYHYTTMKGVFSNQLLNNPNPNQPIAANAGVAGKVYGDDPMIWYGELYIPWIAQGMAITAGRYLSLPDIEAQFAPQNYLMTHSILYTFDAYTNVGVLTTTKLSDQWTVQFGVHGGDDSAPWNGSSRPSLQACVRWVSASNNDMLYPCVESWNGKDQTYNNLQEFVLTWGHRFSQDVHMLTEAYRMYVLNAPGFKPGQQATVGVVNYFNIELDPANMISIRNEWVNDEQGQRSGYATRYISNTIGMTHWLSPDVELRPELRYEHSLNLPAYDGGKKSHQATALFDVILHF